MTPRLTMMNRLFWPRRFGGLERVLWRYANALADAGVHVHVITEAADDLPLYDEPRKNLTIQRQASVQYGRLWRVGELIQTRWWKRSLEQAPYTNIVWANEPTAAAAAIRAGLSDRLLYRPVFCYAGMNAVAQAVPEMEALKRTPLSRWLDRYAYKHAHTVIDESHNLCQQHTQYYGRRPETLVIPNPADAALATTCLRQHYGLSPHHFVIGFVGRPGDPCKDLPFLIRAIQTQAMPKHTRLLIVGGGDGFDDAQRWVHEAGLAPHTIWTGNLDDPAPAYAAMNALVLPSRFETFGNVIVEAHAHGLPALARRADFASTPPIYTASGELIDDGVTGFAVDPHDPADLGTKLLLLAQSPDDAAAIGQAAKARAASYTWADAADRYVQALGLEVTPKIEARQAA